MSPLMVMKFLENCLKGRGDQPHSKSRILISSAAQCGQVETDAVIFPLGEMKQNALPYQMLAHALRIALDLQDHQGLREDQVLKVPEVKEASMGQLAPLDHVAIQVPQVLKVLQAPRDPMDFLFLENRVAKE